MDRYEALLVSESRVLYWSGRPPFRSLRPPLWPITACHSKCYSFRTPVNQTYSFRTSVNQTGQSYSSTGNTRKRLNSSLGREHTMKRCSYQRTAFTIGQDDRLSGQDDHHSDQSTRVIPNVTRSERLSIKLTRSERLSIKLGCETRRLATPERAWTPGWCFACSFLRCSQISSGRSVATCEKEFCNKTLILTEQGVLYNYWVYIVYVLP